MENNNRELVEMFESIPKFDTFSKYNTSLERVFKDYSFKHLLKSLKEQRKPEIYSYFNVEEKKPEINNIYEEQLIRQKKDEAKNSLLSDNDDLDMNILNKKNSTITKKEWRYTVTNPKRRYNPQLDPFRYNPNYNSIFKNVPCARITKPSNRSISINKKLNINRQIESPFLTEIDEKNKTSVFNSNKKRKYIIKNFGNLNILENMRQKRKNINTDENEDRNNHSIRFDKYVDRKDMTLKVNPRVTYLEPHDYHKDKNKSIDFNKMKSREDQFFLNMKNAKGPSVGYYEPHYEYFDKNLRNISLGSESRREKNKKYLLRKMWGNYNVQVDYQLVDNEKLRKDIFKEIKIKH